MFRWWMVLLAFLSMRIVDGEGTGGGDGGDDIDDIGDFEIDDEDIDGDGGNEGKEQPEKIDNTPDENATELKQRLEALEAEKARMDAERAVVEATKELSEKYDDFDIEKIATKLKEMSPEEQEMYNNPVGWEALHLKYFQQKEVSSDPFDPGRNTSEEPFDFDKAYKRVQNGDKKAVIDLFANSK